MTDYSKLPSVWRQNLAAPGREAKQPATTLCLTQILWDEWQPAVQDCGLADVDQADTCQQHLFPVGS